MVVFFNRFLLFIFYFVCFFSFIYESLVYFVWAAGRVCVVYYSIMRFHHYVSVSHDTRGARLWPSTPNEYPKTDEGPPKHALPNLGVGIIFLLALKMVHHNNLFLRSDFLIYTSFAFCSWYLGGKGYYWRKKIATYISNEAFFQGMSFTWPLPVLIRKRLSIMWPRTA